MLCICIFIFETKIFCGYITSNPTQQSANLSQILHKTEKLNNNLHTLKAINMSDASDTELQLVNAFVILLINYQNCFLNHGNTNIYGLNSADQSIFLQLLHDHLQQMRLIFDIINSCSKSSNLFSLCNELKRTNCNDMKAGLCANIMATIKSFNIFGIYYVRFCKSLCPLTYVQVFKAFQQHNDIIVEIYNILNALQTW